MQISSGYTYYEDKQKLMQRESSGFKDYVVSDQFWGRGTRIPERILLIAVIVRAVQDIVSLPPTHIEHKKARRWIYSKDTSRFSFRWYCQETELLRPETIWNWIDRNLKEQRRVDIGLAMGRVVKYRSASSQQGQIKRKKQIRRRNG